ncbi:MAG: DNA methyltransferase [Cyanobacteria bacterium J06627_8]
MGKPITTQSLSRILKPLPPEDGWCLRPSIFLLIGIAIAEAYGLFDKSVISCLVNNDESPFKTLKDTGQSFNHHYGELLPQSWIDQRSLSHHPEPKRLEAPLRAIAIILTESIHHQTLDATWLGQAHEIFLSQSPPRSSDEAAQSPFDSCSFNGRKEHGAYYTPPELVDDVISQTMKPWPISTVQDMPTVLDPACGGGAFLIAAYCKLLHRETQETAQGFTLDERINILRSIHGVDLDEDAIRITRVALHFECLRRADQQSKKKAAHLTTEHLTTEHQRAIAHILNCNLRQGNAIIADGPNGLNWNTAFPTVMEAGGFDIVVGNPPYLDSEQMSVKMPHWRHYCNRHYAAAQGNWDVFCIFIEKALTLCRPGGHHSFVVPNKLASASYAAATRSLLTSHATLQSIRDYSKTTVFSAAVYPLVYVAQRRSPTQLSDSTTDLHEASRPVCYEQMGSDLTSVKRTSWLSASHFSTPHIGWLLSHQTTRTALVLNLSQRFPPLESIAEVQGAASVSEAYALKPFISEQDQSQPLITQPEQQAIAIHPFHLNQRKDDSPNKSSPSNSGSSHHPNSSQHFESKLFPLINSGTIDRYRILWGIKPLRYLGDRYQHPVVASLPLSTHFPRRYDQAIAAKIIVAGMTKRLECVVDHRDCILAGKSTSIIRTDNLPLLYLLGILNSTLMHHVVLQRYNSNSLQGGYLRIGPPQLKSLPIALPSDDLGDRLVAQVQHIISLHHRAVQVKSNTQEAQSIHRQIQSVDTHIDQTVHRLYRLTDEEIHDLLN